MWAQKGSMWIAKQRAERMAKRRAGRIARYRSRVWFMAKDGAELISKGYSAGNSVEEPITGRITGQRVGLRTVLGKRCEDGTGKTRDITGQDRWKAQNRTQSRQDRGWGTG